MVLTTGLGLYWVSGVHTSQRSVPWYTCSALAPFGEYSQEQLLGQGGRGLGSEARKKLVYLKVPVLW